MTSLDSEYIKVSAIYKKLKEAENSHRVIYISGAVGFGKTAAVGYYLRKKTYLLLSGSSGSLSEMPDMKEIAQKTIVIDDISWITDPYSKEYIRNIIRKSRKQIILIGRSKVPSWLQVTSVENHFLLADERDLAFTNTEMKTFLESRGIELPQEQTKQIMEDVLGHPLSMIFVASHLAGGELYNQVILEATRLDLFHYYDIAFYDKWDEEMRQVLLALCQYETFTVEMAETITGNNRIPLLFEKAMEVGTFLTKLDEKNYMYRKPLRLYLKWKQNMVYSEKEKKENYERAALYYQLHNHIEDALYCYKQVGAEDKISSLLIQNAMKHPGTAHFFETREYYLSLPKETVMKSPILISGLCMLYSLTLQKDKSEEWFEILEDYEKNAEKGSTKQKEAKVQIAYLNIALPHRGIHGMVKILMNAAVMMKNKGVRLPEFSVTSNMPSIMNGGLDFCEWSKSDKELAILLKYPIELVLGEYGVGLVNISLAESGFEKGTMPSYEIMTRLNTGYMMSDTSGKIEMCFAALGLMIQEHLANGQLSIGENLLQSFMEKVKIEKAEQLLPNIATFHMWLELMKGNTQEAKVWINTAPDEKIAFCILDRYHYINKVRALISLGRKEEALSLIERLDVYFTQYERHYYWMENQVLKAIILYRMGEQSWLDTFMGALMKAQRYHFIKVIVKEGAAVKPLLDKVTDPAIKKDYLKRLKNEVSQMAVWYPDYLKEESMLKEPLTETEKRILKLLCSGASTEEICNICVCTTSTIKFHNRNIYRKLGVKNRADAEREAVKLGLNL
ncbi:LuxR C-terminal-related transcriptional regulator [Anaerosporobacter faecicola]|uniref:LuxR C-terminal-related transcriptional regulator n=1 Tax=Anaerosporobacter faecicola TaxID=2718714 RepID=UPI001439A032|nr:LuxR C-terminal-related transcriptional regulator [Anaerosporobacter faecicola]